MKIVEIGGAGFIGTRLTRRLLAAGHEVLIVDKVTSETYPELSKTCDVRDPDSLDPLFENCEAIYNLAAEHHDNVRPISLYYDVNVQGSANVLRAAAAAGVTRVIFTSTVAVYGFCDHPADEETEFAPFNDYGSSKAQAEVIHREWAQQDPGEL